jgi:signal peptidase I
VPTGSMKPTILEGDRVFVNKLAYDLKVPFTTWHLAEWSSPARGDVVVFFSPKDETRMVKRVIGLPGDLIELRNDRLFVNGEAMAYGPVTPAVSNRIQEPERSAHQFAREQLPGKAHAMMSAPAVAAPRDFGPYRVPAGAYFMMGDNRSNSYDSRYWGTVERRRIVGRVSSVVLSLDRNHHYAPRWDRFFAPLD